MASLNTDKFDVVHVTEKMIMMIDHEKAIVFVGRAFLESDKIIAAAVDNSATFDDMDAINRFLYGAAFPT